MYDFYLNKISPQYKINDVISNFQYADSLDDTVSSFGFDARVNFGLTSVVDGKMLQNQLIMCEKGTSNIIYYGFITDFTHTETEYLYSYTGYDVGFYLKNNEIIKQFKNINITDAIKNLCDEYSIILGNIPNFQNLISKMYKDENVLDILKEFIKFEEDKGGYNNLFIDCKRGKLEILEYTFRTNILATLYDKYKINSELTVKGVSVQETMQGLKNKVIYSNTDKNSLEKKIAYDKTNIDIYGLLQVVETADTQKDNDLQKLAENKLKELNKTKTDIKLTMLGDYNLTAGSIIRLNIGKYKIVGNYLIKKSNHNINTTTEKVTIDIEKYPIKD